MHQRAWSVDLDADPHIHMKSYTCVAFVVATLVLLGACSRDTSSRSQNGSDAHVLASPNAKTGNGDERLDKLDNIVVIYLENHSFDNLYAEFAAANGLAIAG